MQHKLSEIDELTKMATCAVCGPNTKIRKKDHGGGVIRWACQPNMARHYAKYRNHEYRGQGARRRKVPRYRRLMAEELAAGLCQRCGFVAEDEVQLEVDHKIPIAQGGAVDDKANLWVLCCNCHKLKTKLEKMGQVLGPRPICTRRAE